VSDDRLDQLDYYTLLGAHAAATADELRAAFHAFARRYHPDRHAAAGEETMARAARIYRRGAEAYRVLSDPELRRRYDAQLARGKVRFDPEDAPECRPQRSASGAVVLRSPAARPFYLKAEQALRTGDLKQARLNLQLALRHEGDNAALAAKLASVEARLRGQQERG
jgi:curved DNA-binding protein CbpA